MIAIFAVVYPLGVAVVFFLILWHRPYLFYAPSDYPPSLSVLSFVQAMRSSSLSNRELVSLLKVELSHRFSRPESGASYTQVSDAVEQAIDKTRSEMMAGKFVSVLLKRMDSRQGWADIPISEETCVSDLLDRIWYLISDSVPTYSYGEYWVLTDIETDKGDDFTGRLIK